MGREKKKKEREREREKINGKKMDLAPLKVPGPIFSNFWDFGNKRKLIFFS